MTNIWTGVGWIALEFFVQVAVFVAVKQSISMVRLDCLEFGLVQKDDEPSPLVEISLCLGQTWGNASATCWHSCGHYRDHA